MAATMAATMAPYEPAIPPWTVSEADERRFRRIFLTVLLLCLAFGLSLPWLPRPQLDRENPGELPERLAKLMLEQPPPPLPKPEKRKPEPIQETPQAQPPEVVPPKPRASDKVPEATEKVAATRRKVAGVGLLAMQNELAELHGAPMAPQFGQNLKPGPGVGVGVGAGVGAGSGLGVPERNLITSNATRGSGGINTSGYSRDTGGGGLAGRATTLVNGIYNGSNLPGGNSLTGSGNGARGGNLQRGGSGKAARSIEEIKLVFERHKGAIYALYNRALRSDPALQGKVVLELIIAPGGGVTDCHIVSSELRAAELEAKLLALIRQFDFGAKDVDVMRVNWPVDFLPS